MELANKIHKINKIHVRSRNVMSCTDCFRAPSIFHGTVKMYSIIKTKIPPFPQSVGMRN